MRLHGRQSVLTITSDNMVQDPEQYALYIEEVAPTVAAFGGRYLVRGGAVVLTDSNWQPSRLVVIEFPSSTAALAWVEEKFAAEPGFEAQEKSGADFVNRKQ